MLRLSLVVILIGITYLSLTPSTLVSLGSDKVGHFIAYGILMINLGVLALPKKANFGFGVFFALCYGALMEIGQQYVPGRSMSIDDMYANAGGVFMGAIVAWFIYKPIKRVLTK